MIVEVVDHRLQLFDLGVGGLDGRFGFIDLRLSRLERRIRAVQLLRALVVLFVGGPTFCDERRRAPHLLVREVQLGVVTADFRETGCDRLAGERRRGLGLVQLGHGLGRVDEGHNAPGWNNVAFVRHDLDDASGDLRGDVHLGGLDPAIDTDDACRQLRSLVLLPGHVTRGAAACQDHRCRRNDHIPIEIHGFASESATASRNEVSPETRLASG